MKPILNYILYTMIAMVGLTSCQDDYFDNIYGYEGEGTGGVTLTVDYMPAAGTTLGSRASSAINGDAMSRIDDMCILVFDSQDKFVEMHELQPKQYTDVEKNRTDTDASNNQISGETTTIRRTINLTLSTGRYYIYAVSNLTQVDADGNVQSGSSTANYLRTCGFDSDLPATARKDRKAFRDLRRQWDSKNLLNNREMSGCFTNEARPGNKVFTSEADDETVRVSPGSELHCWLRRMASKVTVTFDSDKLDPSTTIYLRDIRVVDIPYDCSLVSLNKVDETVKNRNTTFGLLYENDPKSTSTSPAGNEVNTQRILLCNEGDEGNPEANHERWPALTSAQYSLDMIDGFPQLANVTHANNAPSLFFYENMQGVGEFKMQDADGTKTDAEGNPLPDPDGKVDSPDSTNPNDPHYKDGKRGGTYVEVRAYYVSEATGNEGRGEITYRFMLGSNTSDNYDVERNHHYKLTLVFHGYANDYDWHVEYERAQVTVTMPNPYYISYGYNEMLELPITVMGEIQGNVTATILRNDWWPSKQWEDTEGNKEYHFDRSKVLYPGKKKTTAPNTGTDIKKAKAYRDDALKKLLSKEYYNETTAHPSKFFRCLDKNDQVYKEGVSLGFLSLRKPQTEVVGQHLSALTDNGGYISPASENGTYHWKIWQGLADNADFVRATDIDNSNRTLGYREYKLSSSGLNHTYDNDENSESQDGSYRVVVTPGTSKTPKLTTLYLPLYTRERNLIKNTSYTGENSYNAEQRRAQVLYSFTVKDLQGGIHNIDTIIDIVQVCKIGNPMGVWRDWNSAAPFKVSLKLPSNDDESIYRNLLSRGGWSAEVEYGQDWILLNGGKRKIYGGNMSPIEFTYRPAGILMDKSKVRCGIILVKYHNYTCTHRIFVRQGYAPMQILDDGVYFQSFNMVSKGKPAKSPIDEGSLFKCGNWDFPIASSNQTLPKWVGFMQEDFKDAQNTNFEIAGSKATKKWHEIESYPYSKYTYPFDRYDGNRDGKIIVNETECRLMTVDDIITLRDGVEGKPHVTRHQYGVLYADESFETHNTAEEVFGFKGNDDSKKTYGMRGCFVYNKTNGSQIFFPIGSTGFGNRKDRKGGNNDIGYGVLRYSAGRRMDMGDLANCQPMFFDLFRRHGAVYWCNSYGSGPQAGNNRTALDLNYFTFDFNTLGSEPITGSHESKYSYTAGDACFVRLVQEKP